MHKLIGVNKSSHNFGENCDIICFDAVGLVRGRASHQHTCKNLTSVLSRVTRLARVSGR